jgi:hypothetical protein
MTDPSNSSFIPKRGPATQKRRVVSRQVYIFTIGSYILLFATLLASGGVFLFDRYVDKQFEESVAELNSAIAAFSETDMQRVLDFDSRLSQAAGRLDASVSMVSVFEALEDATIDTVQVDGLTIVRDNDSKYVLEAAINTDSFDSTIFQRGVYKRNSSISSVEVSDVKKSPPSDNVSEEDQVAAARETALPLVTFSAVLEIPVSEVPYTVNVSDTVNTINDSYTIESDSTVDPDTETEEAGVEGDISGNQTDI